MASRTEGNDGQRGRADADAEDVADTVSASSDRAEDDLRPPDRPPRRALAAAPHGALDTIGARRYVRAAVAAERAVPMLPSASGIGEARGGFPSAAVSPRGMQGCLP